VYVSDKKPAMKDEAHLEKAKNSPKTGSKQRIWG
jgi:hypothetical protein